MENTVIIRSNEDEHFDAVVEARRKACCLHPNQREDVVQEILERFRSGKFAEVLLHNGSVSFVSWNNLPETK